MNIRNWMIDKLGGFTSRAYYRMYEQYLDACIDREAIEEQYILEYNLLREELLESIAELEAMKGMCEQLDLLDDLEL